MEASRKHLREYATNVVSVMQGAAEKQIAATTLIAVSIKCRAAG
jgi:hypothetical protein